MGMASKGVGKLIMRYSGNELLSWRTHRIQQVYDPVSCIYSFSACITRSVIIPLAVESNLLNFVQHQHGTASISGGNRVDNNEVGPSIQTSGSRVEQDSVANGGMHSGPDAKQCVKSKSDVFRSNIAKGEYVSKLRYALANAAGSEAMRGILDQETSTLAASKGQIFIELLKSLQSNPRLALEVFNWKRTRSDILMESEEYSKAIFLAGRARHVNLAVELFAEMESRGIKKSPFVYNALMTVYMYNGLTKRALSLFEDLKRDPDCSPTLVTYNILLSTFGRSMLVDHMKMTFQAIKKLGLSPNIQTYNTLIAGYLTARMWDEMENTLKKMERSSIEPNSYTYSLLVKGYAFSGQVEKMETAFHHLQKQISQKDVPIILNMILVSSKSEDPNKVRTIENLLKFIRKEDYRPWIDVLLINLYAEADAIERMEDCIIGALDRYTVVTTPSVTRSVAAAYFRHDAIDKLEVFVKQAKTAGWTLCHSIYQHGTASISGGNSVDNNEVDPSIQTSGSRVEQDSLANGGIHSGPDPKQCVKSKSDVLEYVSKLGYALANAAGAEAMRRILDQETFTLAASKGRIFIELLKSLQSNPQLALEVFNWKRTRSDTLMEPEEYSKAIFLSRRAKHFNLAVELFAEMESRGIRKLPSVYNALMTVYICNGHTKQALSLFEDLKRDPDCSPTLATYNILLSTFGRSMLVDHMEMTFQAIKELGLSPNIRTYNTLIAGYLTAWMWDEMENALKEMERSSVEPDSSTYSLLVKGYAFSGQVEKMEAAFHHLQKQISQKDVPIILHMILAYFKSKDPNKVRKIENLLKFIRKEDYRPWIDVLLINLFAEADAVERMEDCIIGALDRYTVVTTSSVTRSVAAAYFRHDAIDKLEVFVKHAKTAGWKLCRSIYHSRMLLYGKQNRLNDMENVMEEMKSSHFFPSRKTFLILYRKYRRFGKEDEVKWTLRRMAEAGFDLQGCVEIIKDQKLASLIE